ncbi:MAG: hypothetical protein AAFN10_10545 [Bacteroidota bacterium]
MKIYNLSNYLLIGTLALLIACGPSNVNEPKPHYQPNDLPALQWPPEISGWTYEILQDEHILPASGLAFYPENDFRKSTHEELHFFNETQAYKRLDLLRTEDGGFSWNEIPFADSVNIKHTYFWSLDRGVVAYVPADKDSLIFAYTEDGGANWISHTSNLPNWGMQANANHNAKIYDLWFSDVKNGIFLKSESTDLSLWVTQDSGKTWTRNYGHNPSYNPIQSLDPQTIMLTEGNQLILSQDAGQSWQLIAELPEIQTTGMSIPSFQAMSRDSLFYQVGGVHHNSVDGGQTWTELEETGLILRWQGGECFRYSLTGRQEVYAASNQPYDLAPYDYAALYHKPNANHAWIQGKNEVANQGISRFYHAGPDIVVGQAYAIDRRVLFRYLRN